MFEARCKAQITAALAALESDLASRPGPYWFCALSHADIALACAWRFVTEAHPGLIDAGTVPHLRRLSDGLEATAAFQACYQAFLPPA
jgi:glutathione S-transferase